MAEIAAAAAMAIDRGADAAGIEMRAVEGAAIAQQVEQGKISPEPAVEREREAALPLPVTEE